MPGIADLFYRFSGAPDPSQQLAALLAGRQQPQPPQPGQGPAPPADPNAPAPNAQPVNAPAPNPAPGAPPPPGSPPQPQALQSTPDMSASYQQLANPPNLMSLYLQLQQRQAASDQINRGFALIAANHSAPGMREAIMQSVGGGPDAGQTVNNLMSLYNAQTQMGATQQMLGQSAAIAAKLGLPEDVVRSEILAGRGPDLVKSMEPTDMAKNYAWARKTYSDAHPGASPDEIDEGAQGILLGMGGGGGDSATRSWRAEKILWNQQHPNEPYPWGQDDPASFANWKAKQAELDKDQTDAANRLHSGYAQNITDLRNHLGSIIGLKPGGDPNNDGQNGRPNDYDQGKLDLLKSALSKPGAQGYLSGDPKDATTQALGAALLPEEKAILDEVRDTTDPKLLFGSLNARAPKRGQSDVAEIGSGLSGMQNIRKGFDRFLEGVKSTITASDKALGNGYGAAGEAENAPDYTKPLIDDAYLPGGSMYPYGKKPAPMTPDQITQATAKIKAAQDPEGERQLLIKVARANNIDTKPLQNLRL